MKKILFTLIMLSGMSAANAALYVSYSDLSGVTMNDGVTPILDASVDASQIALVQLIWTSDGVQDLATIGGGVSGANEILDQQNISAALLGNDYAANFAFLVGPSPDRVGSLYVRIFQGGTSVGNVDVGDWYYTGILNPVVVNPGPPSVADDVNLGPLGAGTGDFGTYSLNQQVVPEPTTLALAALGVLGLVARRFRRS